MMFRAGLGQAANPLNSPCPDKPWTDPNRPSWLPCFFDTPTESTMKIEYDAGALYTLPPAPPTIQPPNMATDPTGQTVNPDAQIAQQAAAEKQQLTDFAGQQAQQTPVQTGSLPNVENTVASYLPGGDTSGSFMNLYGPYLIIGGAILFGVMAFTGKR